MATEFTAIEVAEWMAEKFLKDGYLYQGEVVDECSNRLGRNHLYQNQSGNDAISAKVLTAFRNLTASTAVWSNGQKVWRRREVGDEPGRGQNS